MKQHVIAIWFTGLSGSGKSTLASALKQKMKILNSEACIFDGDIIRQGLNSDLGFSLSDRIENIRRIAEVNRLFLDSGLITINAFISPTEKIRGIARNIIGQQRFFEVYLSTPLETCRERDVKGLYKRVAEGDLKNFTGIDSIFEPSIAPSLYIDTSKSSVSDCIALIIDKVQEFQCNTVTCNDYEYL